MTKRRGNGEGTITKRKDGRWEARYTVYTDKGGSRRVLYGKTRQETADKLAKALVERADGLIYDDENVTVGDNRRGVPRWLAQGFCVWLRTAEHLRSLRDSRSSTHQASAGKDKAQKAYSRSRSELLQERARSRHSHRPLSTSCT